MRLNLIGGVVAALVLVALIVAYSTMFTVYETRQALVVRLGQPVRVVTEPGLHFKVPLIDSVIHIDKRILDLESPSLEVIASDQKRLVVDAFARYKITQPLLFYQTVSTVEGANSRLATLLNSALRRVLGEATLTHVVRDDRAALMTKVNRQLEGEAKAFGIEVIDVRIRRADLPEQNSQAVYQRMQTERQREAAEFRAQGSQRAQEIRARADRDVTVLLAEAQAKGDAIRGEGDGTRNRIFAEAFGRDPDFFAFYRTMQAYEAGLRGGDASTRMLLRPDSDFFRYFIDPSGRTRPGVGPPPGTSPPGTSQGAAPSVTQGAGSGAAQRGEQATPK
jgi:membrane protease subunit HflC